jgi:hypothetical protein
MMDEERRQADENRQRLETRVVGKALKDDTYRQELLANPRAAVEQELGMQLPSEMHIRVVEMETPNTLYIVLPPQQQASGELSDADLESVAGGIGGQVVGATCRGSGCGEAAITLLIGGGCSRALGG